MTPLMRTRCAELADALEGPDSACHADVRALVELTEAVRAVPAPALRANFRAELRSDLLVAIRRELTERGPERRPHPVAVTAPRRRRLAVAATAAFVVAGGGAGAVATSAAALPGELLYPVKRAAERVDLAVHSDDSTAGHILLEHAETRLAEAQELVAQSERLVADDLVAGTLTDFSAEATSGAETLLTAFDDSGEQADIETLRTFAASAAASLESLGPGLPPSSYEAYAAAAATVGAVDSEAVRACPACAGGTPAITLVDVAEGVGLDIGSGRVPQPAVPDSSRPGRTLSTPGAIAPTAPTEMLGSEVPAGGNGGSGGNGGDPDTGALGPVGSSTAPPGDAPQPKVPQPSLPEPSLPEPSLPEPSLPGPSLPGPSLPVPSVPGPGVPGQNVPVPDDLMPNNPVPNNLVPSVPSSQ